MLIDYHIHSTFSNDSHAQLGPICQQAIAQNITEIAITDHVDYKYPIQPPSYAIEDFETYFNTLEKYRQQYRGQLKIKVGLEIGLEEHHLVTYDDLLNRYPFDFVIASVHMIDGLEPHLGEYYRGKTKEEAYRQYYQYISAFLDHYQNFDVLGHLDYVKRYMPYPYEPGDQLLALDAVEEVLKKLIAMGKGIEINTSSFKHRFKCSMPHYDIIEDYHRLGGTRLTIGTDSHDAKQVGFQVAETAHFLKSIGIDEISTFTERQETPVKL